MTNFLKITLTHPVRRASLALLLLSCAALPGLAQDNPKEQLTVNLSSPNKPGTLEVGLVNGFIHVTGYNGKSVVIDATSRAVTNRRAAAAETGGLKRLSAGTSLNLTVEEKNNNVEISTESHARPVDLTIKVPENFSLKISTVNNGDIIVDNVNGELEINNVNGSITLKQVSGSAVATTVNGNLIATFNKVTSGAPMAFSTLNGKVDVTFPSNAKAALKMKSERGEVYSDFDVAVDKSTPKVTKTSENGLTRLSTDDWTYGKVNGGGAEVMMKTFNGNIYLRKAK
ncbi:hypothetical protein I2I05_06115 [Hymenobacter sp. BT683]|uniref:DUF4097 domain-containing protein n=1 Tax=Hymenobacter jeongseonensis TaxID=2791027 RepID=A0ABS0IF70_9BACT|nr:DUF4097 family beta strand repeat-containing protein [Hymenobacter jeongseonensis]MBF9236965.1 hypothetical protein [Hymenobacter jeongseonensis]